MSVECNILMFYTCCNSIFRKIDSTFIQYHIISKNIRINFHTKLNKISSKYILLSI